MSSSRPRALIFLSALGAFTSACLPAEAILDTNSNGLSDLWERRFNHGLLFDASFYKGDDDDGDGWTNRQEAEAGTDPRSARPPFGMIRPEVEITPAGQALLTWPQVLGKHYEVEKSTTLLAGSWSLCSEPITPSGGSCTSEIHPGDDPADPLFLRITVSDRHSDADQLTDTEELTLGTDPYSADTDGDGLMDHEDPLPFNNPILTDPDGQNLDASLANGLIGRWDCESIGTFGTSRGVADIAPDGVAHHALSAADSLNLDNSGIISKGVRFNNWDDSLSAPGTLFAGRPAFSFSMWFKCQADTIQSRGGVVLFSLNTQLTGYPPLMLFISRAPTAFASQNVQIVGYAGASLVPIGTGALATGVRLDDGHYHHVSFVKSGTSGSAYIDGSLLASGVVPSTYTSTSTGYFSFGKAIPVANDTGTMFLGTMDRLRFYSRALTVAEIGKLYHHDSDGDGDTDLEEIESGTDPAVWGR
ncbi:LamG domain-containing protein [Haloferula sargassicola]